MPPDQQTPQMNPAELYRDEVVTDRHVGTIRVMTPIKSDGSVDASRKVEYVGQASLYTPAGTIPINFDIPAGSLDEAVKGFSAAAQKAVQETMEELNRLRREAASGLVIADSIPGKGPGGLGGKGGGGIQLP
jgi:hypothetical protein